jgi:hypothetical protein
MAQYLLNAADDPERQKTTKLWDYDKKAEVEVEGFYINGKGRQGNDGDFGTINPAATKSLNQGLTTQESKAVSGEIPF